MKYLTVQDYANEQGVSAQSVYAKIKRGTLQTITKRVNKKDITFVIMDLDDNENSNIDYTLYNVVEQNKSSQKEYPEIIEKLHDDYKALVIQNVELAQLAGQAKLLTDSEHRTQQTCIILGQEKQALIEERAELKAQLDLKDQQLKEYQEKLKKQEESRNSSWWSKL